MTKLFSSLAIRFLRGHWGKILPRIFKAAAEGEFGEAIKKVYWFGAGYRTITGALLWGIGGGLETVCSNYPDFAWTCEAGRVVYSVGAILATVGLLDGAVRSPWPEGSQAQHFEK